MNDNSKEQKPVSIARGNIVLVDHGYTVVPDEPLEDISEKGKFRPHLSKKPLTHKGPFDPLLPASTAFNYDIREAYPDISLREGLNIEWVELIHKHVRDS